MAQSPVVGDTYLSELKRLLETAKTDTQLYEAIVNAPFHDKRTTTMLGLGFLSFVLVNKRTRTIDRISITKNELSQGAIDITIKPFHDLKVPVSYKGNCVSEAIRSGRYQQTNDWNYLLTPVLKPEEARLNQAGAGIASSYVYPLTGSREAGAIIFQYFITLDKIENTHREFMFRYTKLVSRALR